MKLTLFANIRLIPTYYRRIRLRNPVVRLWWAVYCAYYFTKFGCSVP